MSEAITVRPARASDAEAICVIYNQGIEDRATLETQLRTPSERRQWLASRGPRHPVVVAEVDGDRPWRGRGVGKVLLGHLIEQGQLNGEWVDPLIMEKLL